VPLFVAVVNAYRKVPGTASALDVTTIVAGKAAVVNNMIRSKNANDVLRYIGDKDALKYNFPYITSIIFNW